PDVGSFFSDAARVVAPGGALVMIEPWVSRWARLVYTNLHHEPFLPQAGWTLQGSGPLSTANSALPWIVFARDRERFDRDFPSWRVDVVDPGTPLLYFLSGGVSKRGLSPGWAYPLWRACERALTATGLVGGMFARIVLVRRDSVSQGST